MTHYPTNPEFLAASSDVDLLDSYERTTGHQNDEEAIRLVAAIGLRGIDS